MIKQIYLVYGCYEYESSTTLCAYVNEQDALDFAAVCRQYDELAPEPPVGINNLEDYKALAMTRFAWLDAHPAKNEYEHYSVESIELK
jgi:hypothetical protein